MADIAALNVYVRSCAGSGRRLAFAPLRELTLLDSVVPQACAEEVSRLQWL
jgi:hypothetical protein